VRFPFAQERDLARLSAIRADVNTLLKRRHARDRVSPVLFYPRITGARLIEGEHSRRGSADSGGAVEKGRRAKGGEDSRNVPHENQGPDLCRDERVGENEGVDENERACRCRW